MIWNLLLHTLGRFRIACNTDVPMNVKWEQILKDALFKNMEDENGKKLNYCPTDITDDYLESIFIFPQTFIKAVYKRQSKLKRPFLLIPLFKILDAEKNEVNYKFFEHNEYNAMRERLPEGFCYFVNNHIFKGSHKLKLNSGKAYNIDTRISLHYERSGYLIFKSPDSECAMVYGGLFFDVNDKYFSNSELGEVYNYYIGKLNTKNDEIKRGHITLEVELDITPFKKNIPLDTRISPLGINIPLKFNLPEELKKSSSNLVIKLRGKKLKNKDLGFEIYKYIDSKRVDGLHFTMDLGTTEAQNLYYHFKERLLIQDYITTAGKKRK